MKVADFASYLGVRKTICAPRLADRAPYSCDLVHTLRIHLFFYSQHGDAQACLEAHSDFAILVFDYPVFGVQAVHPYRVRFFLAKYSFALSASFSNGFRLFPTKPSSFNNVLLALPPPSIPTFARTRLPIHIVLHRSSCAPLLSDP